MAEPDAAAAAALATQMASAAAGPQQPGGGAAFGSFVEAALTLLTSAAATSSAAGQLRTLVLALHSQQVTPGVRPRSLCFSLLASGFAGSCVQLSGVRC
jgi:hypothetical protein